MSERQTSENASESARGKAQSSTYRKRLHDLPTENFSVVSENNSKRRRLEPTSGDAESETVKKPLSLISLNDYVLLHVCSYLNWVDTIELAASCDRFYHLHYLWQDKRYQEFHLDDYMEIAGNLPKTMLRAIAPHIKILATGTHNKRIMKLFKNLESLRIEKRITRVAASRINSWIKDLNIKSLWFERCSHIDALLDGVTGLLELEISYFHRNTERILEQNINLKRLSIELRDDYNFRVFGKLQALQSLHIRSFDFEDLTGIREFGSLENLTEFSLENNTLYNDPHTLYSFMKHLSKKSKLEKLQLVDCVLDDGFFGALKSFNLSVLSLCSNVSTQEFKNFVLENPSLRLKQLKLSSCTSEQLFIVIEKWTSLETICLFVDEKKEHKRILGRAFVNKILKTSRNRLPLTLHVSTTLGSKFPRQFQIFINFPKQQFRTTGHTYESFCSFTNSFKSSTRACFLK